MREERISVAKKRASVNPAFPILMYFQRTGDCCKTRFRREHSPSRSEKSTKRRCLYAGEAELEISSRLTHARPSVGTRFCARNYKRRSFDDFVTLRVISRRDDSREGEGAAEMEFCNSLHTALYRGKKYVTMGLQNAIPHPFITVHGARVFAYKNDLSRHHFCVSMGNADFIHVMKG